MPGRPFARLGANRQKKLSSSNAGGGPSSITAALRAPLLFVNTLVTSDPLTHNVKKPLVVNEVEVRLEN